MKSRSGNKAKNKDIYITDISFEADEEELRKLFSVCGTVQSVHLLEDPNSGKFSGRAFVRMATTEQAREAVNMLDGTRLLNRCIKVKAARDKQPAPVKETTSGTRPARRPRPKRTRS